MLNSIKAVDSLHAWAAGQNGMIWATSDGGQTWGQQTSGCSDNLLSITFVDVLHGWVGYSGSDSLILHTDDGGWAGVWEEPSRLTPHTSRLTVRPNPFTSFATVPGHEAERFSLYDISGRKVGTYLGDRIGEGLAAGVYFVRAEKGDRKPLRVVKVR